VLKQAEFTLCEAQLESILEVVVGIEALLRVVLARQDSNGGSDMLLGLKKGVLNIGTMVLLQVFLFPVQLVKRQVLNALCVV